MTVDDSFKTTYIGLYLMYKILENTEHTKLKFYKRENIGFQQNTLWASNSYNLTQYERLSKWK